MMIVNLSRIAILRAATYALLIPLPAAAAEDCRLATYESATGETYFALSLSPTKPLLVADSHDVVVLIDTSATQSGQYRTQSLDVLAALVKSLGENDRVQLAAIDIRPIPLTSGFVPPGSEEMKAALAKLSKRAPLGATDMSKALDYIGSAFPAESKAARAAVYLGDGMNKASYLAGDKFSTIVDRLVEQQIPVSSCGIGVQRNVALLAAIAKQTGGDVTMANPDEVRPQDAGHSFAAIVQTPVAWPTDVNLSKQFTEYYPAKVPPLRSDRDTVLIGLEEPGGALDIHIDAISGGEKVQFQWSPTPEPSNEDFAFLPRLVDIARPDRGATLPTVGSQGLREAARLVMTRAEDLAELGHKALASGDAAGASRAAKAALERDPGNPTAAALLKLSERSLAGRAGAGATETIEPDLTLVRFADAAEPGIERFDGGEGELLGKVDEYRAAQAGMIRAETEEGLKSARQMLADGNSQGAVQELKKLQENLDRAPDLDAATRSDLLARVDSAIREAQRRMVIDDFRKAEALQRAAVASEQQRVLSEISTREQMITQLMERFTSLMEEGRYNDAERDVIPNISQLSRDSTIAASSMWWADFARNINQMNDLVVQRNEMFNDALYQVELAHVPFPDEPPIIYPSAEVWEDITIRREKYKSVDIVRPGSAEENIMKELENEAKVDVIETPFSDVIRDIAKDHEITIVLDPEGLEEADVTPDQLITLNLKGISLRSVLRILLGPLHLTYVVKDEVLQITSEEKAAEQLVTKVYPVGDLVVPIRSPMMMGGMMGRGMMGGMGMGGMGMGGMGMGGMGMGGMGMGGMGGMGGMMGGMGGMGGFGGGGFFRVEDRLAR